MHLNKFYQNALILLALDTLDDRSGYMEMVIREKVDLQLVEQDTLILSVFQHCQYAYVQILAILQYVLFFQRHLV